MDRLIIPGCSPTNTEIADVAALRLWEEAVSEHGLHALSYLYAGYNYRKIKVPTALTVDDRRWAPQFEHALLVFLVVDLTSYDQLVPGNMFSIKLQKTIGDLNSLISCRFYRSASFLICLNNIGEFKQKLKHIPFSNYFPDFSGGSDPAEACNFIIKELRWHTKERARDFGDLYTCCTDDDDTEIGGFLISVVRDCEMARSLRDSGIA